MLLNQDFENKDKSFNHCHMTKWPVAAVMVVKQLQQY
jgi:hypothetical protein